MSLFFEGLRSAPRFILIVQLSFGKTEEGVYCINSFPFREKKQKLQRQTKKRESRLTASSSGDRPKSMDVVQV